jgi:ribonuclease J
VVTLTFYGGVNEIGGNKVLVEDSDLRLLLDFGFPYKTHKMFFEEYLKPRGGAGLRDPLSLGLLPPLEGLYREELEEPGLWGEFRRNPLHRRIDSVDGVLLSHAHLDHSGYISFLKPDIPVFCTATTAFVSKAMQDSGRSDFDQNVCYFPSVQRKAPPGWKQEAFLSDSRAPKRQRQFCIADRDPGSLSEESLRFWQDGFWKRSSKQVAMDSRSLQRHDGRGVNVRCLPVDHSIPGACGWAFETSSGWIVYSGDLRLHGSAGHLTRAFMEHAAQLRPTALILEGTNVNRQGNTFEHEVHENCLKAVSGCTGLVIADFPARDADRLTTLLQVARETRRKLAVTPKRAYLLKTLRLLDPTLPDVACSEDIAVYQDTRATTDGWMRGLCEECEANTVVARDIASAQDQFILCFNFFDINDLPSIPPRAGSLYLFSSSEPHDEEQEIDFRRLHNWIRHFDLTPFGLPVETHGVWQIPEEQRGLHASGHACGPDLIEVARTINPRCLIPIHSEQPEFYEQALAGSGIEVRLPKAGGSLTI